MSFLMAFVYLMAMIGLVATGSTLVAYWMIWKSSKRGDR